MDELKISELIEKLKKIREENGDLPVYYFNDAMHDPVRFFNIKEAIPERDEEGDEMFNGGLPRRVLIS